jgi:hypothetical protein
MTCCIAWVGQQGTYVAADSAMLCGYDAFLTKVPKIICRPGFSLAASGSLRWIQAIHLADLPNRPEEKEDAYEWAIRKLVPAIRTATKDLGLAKVSDNVETVETAVLATAGRVFRLESNLQICENMEGLDICGCGEDFARGALHALLRGGRVYSDLSVLSRILVVAEVCSVGVSKPFFYVKIGEDRIRRLRGGAEGRKLHG